MTTDNKIENGETVDSVKRLYRNIGWLRRHYGFSFTQMAAIIGISERQLRCVEAGETTHPLRADKVLRISRFFLLRIECLLETDLTALDTGGIEYPSSVQIKPAQPGG